MVKILTDGYNLGLDAEEIEALENGVTDFNIKSG